jgi:glutamyl-tRNA synthetase
MTVEQMVELFSVEGLSRNAAVFDTKKLEWMNGQHLSMTRRVIWRPLWRRA